MWFGMNKTIKIGTNQGTLLIWISNSCLDHNDVTWDVQKGGVLENKKRIRWDREFSRRIGGVGGTCSRKP